MTGWPPRAVHKNEIRWEDNGINEARQMSEDLQNLQA